MPLLSGIPANVLSESQQVGTAQAALKNMGLGTALTTTMTIDTTLYSGVLSAANLSSTAGITLTLDGGFNIVDGTAVRVSNIPAVPEPSIYWMLAAGLGLLGLLKHRKQPGI